VHWRSLGRSLPANFIACSALLAALRLPPPSRKASSVLTASFQSKKEIRKRAGSSACRYNIKKPRGRGNAKPLAFSASKTAWAGRGPHPAPRLALSFKKIAFGN